MEHPAGRHREPGVRGQGSGVRTVERRERGEEEVKAGARVEREGRRGGDSRQVQVRGDLDDTRLHNGVGM